MSSTDRSKGLQYSMTFSPLSEKNTGNNQIAIMGYLNEKIKYLEIENNELKKEISMKSNDKEKIEYYLRLRREFLEEIERMRNQYLALEVNSKTTIEKLQDEIESLTQKIKIEYIHSPVKSNEEELFSTERTGQLGNLESPNLPKKTNSNNIQNTSKYFQNLIENEIGSNFSEDNFFLNPGSSQNFNNPNNNTKLKDRERENIMFQSTVPYSGANLNSNSDDMQVNQNTSQLNHNQSTHNPFLPLINDLEERIKLLEGTIKEKDQEILQLQEHKLSSKFKSDSEIEKLIKEVESWRQKYIIVLSSKKSLSQEYQELYDKQIENYKKQTDKTIYELERKILHLEKMNEKYEQELEKLAKMNAEAENIKQNEIEQLKINIKVIIDHYEQLYKNYEENLRILTKQIDSLKQLYVARESEFINITNYYTETINDYSKPITDMNNTTNYKSIEENFTLQTKEVESLRKKIEEYIKEISQIRTDNVEAKPKIRQKISDAMKLYDQNIRNIIDNHSTLESKLENIINFMNNFETKFIFFNSLIEDNKKMEEKINLLECQIKMIDPESKDKENIALKEQIFKLQKDIEMKNNLIKEYEEAIPKHHESLSNVSSKPLNRRAKETAPDEIIFKLKSEITILTSQIVNLNKTKDGIEKFYQVELRNLMEKINEKNEKLEELRSIIRRMENDFMGKKETVFNLWMLEFKEFKENLITISDIRSIIEKFKIEGEELTVHKDRVYNEELYMLRQEISIKDDSFAELKNNFDLERNNLINQIEGYKKTIDGKVVNYENLLTQKKLELAALKNEKDRLLGLQNNKKKLTENEMNIWNEQREHIKNILIEHEETKNKEISLLKNQVDLLQNELETSRKLNESNLQNVINSIENQLNLLKDRELFTVSQLLEVEDKFTIFREEKERMISLLKEEVQEIKGHNLLLSKIKTEESIKS